MQVNRNVDLDSYSIHSYAPGQVTVTFPPLPAAAATTAAEKGGAFHREVLRRSLIIMPDRLITDWPPQRFEELDKAHFDLIAELAPEVVLFGSGSTLQRPHPSLLSVLTNLGIGVEVMDTGSACRTYNFLMSDRRKVAAALLMIMPA